MRADQLNAYNVYLRQPDSFQVDLDRYLGATADSLRDMAGRWLTREAALALAVVSEGSRDALPDARRLDRTGL